MNGRRRQMRRVHVQCGPKKKKRKKKALFLINSCTYAYIHMNSHVCARCMHT